MKEPNMAATDKDVNISVSNMTITVQILFPAGIGGDYDPLKAQVTVKRPDGVTDDLTDHGTAISGGAQFVDTVQQAGQYAVNVVCSDKSFGDTVPVSPATNPTVSSFTFRAASSSLKLSSRPASPW
jgi:hypothetical protein